MNFSYEEICKIIGDIVLTNAADKRDLGKHLQELQEQYMLLKTQQFKDGQPTSTENSK